MHRITAAALALLLAACAAPDGASPPADGPADPSAEIRPDLLIADPVTVSPGEVVAMTFPQETFRGVLFVLERREGDRWEHRYDLMSDGPGPGWQLSWSVADEGLAVPDIGVGGLGPDRVPIPETAEPGEYRICTGNAGDEFCTPIEIVAP